MESDEDKGRLGSVSNAGPDNTGDGAITETGIEGAINATAVAPSQGPSERVADSEDEEEGDQYWNIANDADGVADCSDVSTDYDIDIYLVEEPVKLRNKNRRLKGIRKRLARDYRSALAQLDVSSEPDRDRKFPSILYRKKWGLIRPQVPPSDGSSPISNLPDEVLRNVFHKLFYLRLLGNYRKMDVSKVACVCRRFNDALQPVLFNVLNISNIESFHELAGLLLQSPYLGPMVQTLHLKLCSSTRREARMIARTLYRIVKACPNLVTITANLSGATGHNLVVPKLDPAQFRSIVSSVRHLNFLFESYTMPFTIFAQGFENLRVLQLGHTDLSRLVITEADLKMKLPSVVYLQLMAPILTPNGIKLIASALPNVQAVDATSVSGGMSSLLNAMVDSTESLMAVTLRRCNWPKGWQAFTGRLWKRLRAVEIYMSSFLTANIFPSHASYGLDCLPDLESLKVTADILLPMQHDRFAELMDTVNRLPALMGATAPAVDGQTSRPRKDVEIRVTCQNFSRYDSWGTTLLVTTPSQPHYNLLDTVGSPGARQVVKIGKEELERLRMDLGILGEPPVLWNY